MKYFKTLENFPIMRKGMPSPGEVEITEEEYKILCDERNVQAEVERVAIESIPKPKSEIDTRLEKIEADILLLKKEKEVANATE